jgi:putative acetyltransferase
VVAAAISIRPETAADHGPIRGVVAGAFVDQPVVADLVDALRASSAWRPGLSLVAERDGEIVGHVLATRGWLDAPIALVEVLVLSPLSVAPHRQRRGVGAALVNELLAIASQRTESAIFLEGSPRYYSRFGFEPAGEAGMRRPSLRIPEAAFQMRQLPSYDADLSGTLVYPEPFWSLDCVGLR